MLLSFFTSPPECSAITLHSFFKVLNIFKFFKHFSKRSLLPYVYIAGKQPIPECHDLCLPKILSSSPVQGSKTQREREKERRRGKEKKREKERKREREIERRECIRSSSQEGVFSHVKLHFSTQTSFLSQPTPYHNSISHIIKLKLGSEDGCGARFVWTAIDR